VPSACQRGALQGSEADLRCQKASQALEDLRPPNQSEQQGRTVPHIVKRDDDGAEVQEEKAFEEDPRGPRSARA